MCEQMGMGSTRSESFVLPFPPSSVPARQSSTPRFPPRPAHQSLDIASAPHRRTGKGPFLPRPHALSPRLFARRSNRRFEARWRETMEGGFAPVACSRACLCCSVGLGLAWLSASAHPSPAAEGGPSQPLQSHPAPPPRISLCSHTLDGLLAPVLRGRARVLSAVDERAGCDAGFGRRGKRVQAAAS